MGILTQRVPAVHEYALRRLISKRDMDRTKGIQYPPSPLRGVQRAYVREDNFHQESWILCDVSSLDPYWLAVVQGAVE